MKRKAAIRKAFREAVFGRDNYTCRCCGAKGFDRQEKVGTGVALDAHHITDRHDIANGGYVKENGISVCDTCHLNCEAALQQLRSDDASFESSVIVDGYYPDELYRLIGSSSQEAHRAAERLK